MPPRCRTRAPDRRGGGARGRRASRRCPRARGCRAGSPSPPVGLSGAAIGTMTFWPAVSVASLADLGGSCARRRCVRFAVQEARRDQLTCQHRTPPAACRSVATKRPPGRQVGDDRGPLGDLVELVDLERDVRARGRSRAGAAPRSSSRRWPRRRRSRCRWRSRVRIALGRVSSRTSRIARRPASGGCLRLERVGRRDVVQAGGADADELDRHRHRVGRELAAARAGAGAGDVLELVHFVGAHPAGGVRADDLEDVLDRDVAATEPARGDRAVVERRVRGCRGARAPLRRPGSSCRSPPGRRARRTGGRGRPARSSRRSPHARRARPASPRCPSRRRRRRRWC